MLNYAPPTTVHYLTPTNIHDCSSFVVRRECRGTGPPMGTPSGRIASLGLFLGRLVRVAVRVSVRMTVRDFSVADRTVELHTH